MRDIQELVEQDGPKHYTVTEFCFGDPFCRWPSSSSCCYFSGLLQPLLPPLLLLVLVLVLVLGLAS